jgi:hypothetical protein
MDIDKTSFPTRFSCLQGKHSLRNYDWRATTRASLHTGRMRGKRQNVADGGGELAGDLAISPDLQNSSGWLHVTLLYYDDDSFMAIQSLR